MSSQRFTFQQQCVERTTGKVLNVGCKEDPAGLKSRWPERVINLDRNDYDEDKLINEHLRVSIPVDVIHDITIFPWPFEDKSFDVVVLGDILEDLPDDDCQQDILLEAARISAHLCVTTPQDGPERDAHHQTRITAERLNAWLEAAGWKVEGFETVNYGFVPEGYFVYATAAAEHSAGPPPTKPKVVEPKRPAKK